MKSKAGIHLGNRSKDWDTNMLDAIDGSTVSTFDHSQSTPGFGTINFGPAEGQVSAQTWMNGNNLGVMLLDASELGWANLEQATYECTEDSLILTPSISGVSISPLVFTR